MSGYTQKDMTGMNFTGAPINHAPAILDDPHWWVDEPVHKSGPALAAILLTVPLVLGTLAAVLVARRR